MKQYDTYFEDEWDGGISFRAAEWEWTPICIHIRCYELINDDYRLTFQGVAYDSDKARDAAQQFAWNGEIHHMLRRITE